jgi:hypothetical protein
MDPQVSKALVISLSVAAVLLLAATITLAVLFAKERKRTRIQVLHSLKDQTQDKIQQHQTDTDMYLLGRALSAPLDDALLEEKNMCKLPVIISMTSSPKRLPHITKIL